MARLSRGGQPQPRRWAALWYALAVTRLWATIPTLSTNVRAALSFRAAGVWQRAAHSGLGRRGSVLYNCHCSLNEYYNYSQTEITDS